MNEDKRAAHEPSQNQFLEGVMNQFGNEVLYIAYSYVKDYSLAEDLAQEVFVKVYKQYHTFRSESSLKTWLIRITINQCKDYLKSWQVRKVILTNKIHSYVKHGGHSSEAAAVNNENSKELYLAVLSLPLKYREVIFLYFFEGMKLQEISECLGQNLNTIKSRFIKAKFILNGIYEKEVLRNGR